MIEAIRRPPGLVGWDDLRDLVPCPHVSPSGRHFLLAFLVVISVATALRLWGIETGLPHLMTRPDEEVLLFKTRHPARGSLDLHYASQHPGVPSAYIFLLWAVGEVGLPVLQALGAAPAGDYLHALDHFPGRLLLLERLFSAVAGIATVAALLLFARREMGTAPAIAAGVLLATCFLHVRESHSAKPDVALGFWVTVALGTLAGVARKATLRGALGAGAAIGFAMAMKPPGVLLFAPAWLACVLGTTTRGPRRFLPGVLIALGWMAATVFLVTSPDLIFNAETRRQVLGIVSLVFPSLDPSTSQPASVAPLAPVAPEASPLRGYAYYSFFALRHGAGGLLTLAAPLAVVWGLLSRAPLPTLSAFFVLIGFAAFGASPAMHARYLVPLLPALALLVAGAVWAGLARVLRRPWHGIASTAVIALLVFEPLRASIAFDRVVARTDTRVLASDWLQHNVPPGSVVAVAGMVFWVWGEPRIPAGLVRRRTDLDEQEFRKTAARYLVTHDHPLFSSTIDPAALARLAPQLRLRAEFDPFVGPAAQAAFDAQDAYYVPIAGFDAVERPGPIIRIYEVGTAARIGR